MSVRGGATGRVVETWKVLKGTNTFKTITRSTNRLQVDQASLVLPAESGIPGLVLGYVSTGSYQSISARLSFAPEVPVGGGSSEQLRKAIGSEPARFDHLFVQEFEAIDPSKVVGLSWAEPDDGDPSTVQQRSTLLNTGRTDLDAAVLTEPDGNEWISWASDTEIGVTGFGACPRSPQSARGGHSARPGSRW